MPKSITLNSTNYFIRNIPSKRENQQTAFNHLSDTDFKVFMNLNENALQNHIIYIWINHVNLASDNPLRFRKNLLKTIYEPIKATDDDITNEKLQPDIKRKAAKTSALSSKKLDNCEYLTGEKILLSNQREIVEQAKFAYFVFGKAFEKEGKTI